MEFLKLIGGFVGTGVPALLIVGTLVFSAKQVRKELGV
jgi:hypothetical protein